MGSDTDTWHSTQGGGILSCDWSEHLNTGLWLAAGYLGGMMTRWNVHLVCRVRQRDTEWGHSLDMIRDSDWSNNLNTGLLLAEIFTGQVAVTTCHNTNHTYTSASWCLFEQNDWIWIKLEIGCHNVWETTFPAHSITAPGDTICMRALSQFPYAHTVRGPGVSREQSLPQVMWTDYILML